MESKPDRQLEDWLLLLPKIGKEVYGFEPYTYENYGLVNVGILYPEDEIVVLLHCQKMLMSKELPLSYKLIVNDAIQFKKDKQFKVNKYKQYVKI